MEELKREMTEIERKRAMEHKDIVSEVIEEDIFQKIISCMFEQIGTELAPLMKSATTGKPRKDPDTGYMMAHNLPTTDVTRLAVNA